MEFRKGMFVHGIWFVPSAKQDMDWMGCFVKDGDRWILEYRFRYYKNPGVPDDDPYSGKDTKHFYEARSAPNADPAPLVRAIHETAAVISKCLGCPVDYLDLQCDGADPKLLFELGAKSWSHLKLTPKGESHASGTDPSPA